MGAALRAIRAATDRGRRPSTNAVLVPGFHALKHALRFGAEIAAVVVREDTDLQALAEMLAPDVPRRLGTAPEAVTGGVFASITAHPPSDGVLAVATPVPVDATALLADGDAPVVVLDSPRHLGNLGAAVRVAAAAGAAGLVAVGDADPWHPLAVRAAAGLQFAIPTCRVDDLPATTRHVLLLDPGAPPLGAVSPPRDAVLVFGSERHGVSDALRTRASSTAGLPMRDGVSSLNLATTVAATLYALRGVDGGPAWSRA